MISINTLQLCPNYNEGVFNLIISQFNYYYNENEIGLLLYDSF